MVYCCQHYGVDCDTLFICSRACTFTAERIRTSMANLMLTTAIADELAAAVARGVPIETAAQAAGIGHTTVYRWIEIARDGYRRDGDPVTPQSLQTIGYFGEKIARAQAEFEAKQVSAIVEDADAYNSKTGQRDWRARAWLLNNHPRTRARQEHVSQVTTSGTIDHVHTVAAQQDTSTLDSWVAALELPAGDQG